MNYIIIFEGIKSSPGLGFDRALNGSLYLSRKDSLL